MRFSPGTLVSSTNKTYRQDITEALLRVALNSKTITLTLIVLWLPPNKTACHYVTVMLLKVYVTCGRLVVFFTLYSGCIHL